MTIRTTCVLYRLCYLYISLSKYTTICQVTFMAFCKQHHLQPCPTSKYDVALFAAHLSKTLSIKTIRVYLAAISYLHHSNGFQSPVTRKPEAEACSQRTPKGTGGLVRHCKKATTHDKDYIGVVQISVCEQDPLLPMTACCRQPWQWPSLSS